MAQAKKLARWLERDRAGGCFLFVRFKAYDNFYSSSLCGEHIIPTLSFSASSVISTSVSKERSTTEKHPCPRVITEEPLWGKVVLWSVWFSFGLGFGTFFFCCLTADLLFIIILGLGHSKSRFYWFWTFMGEGVGSFMLIQWLSWLLLCVLFSRNMSSLDLMRKWNRCPS